MNDDATAIRAVLDFWFGEIGPERWWTRSEATDDAIVARFRDLRERWRARPAEDFLESADAALAAVVLFDQFPRNMFRRQARAFATDALALAVARGALARGLDRAMSDDGLSFLYMPFMHAEDIAMQDEAVRLFARLGRPEPLRYAEAHRAMIARYGRFPARNSALGRPDRPGEAEGIAQSKDW